jgi:hypothetical protein
MDGGVTEVVQCLLCKYKTLSSNSSPTKTKQNEKAYRSGGVLT